MRFENKVAIVTGAAGGIGATLSRRLVAEGARVMMVDRVDGPLRDAAAPLGDAVRTTVADVSVPADVARYVRACVEQFGRVDVLFDNAGIEGKFAKLVDVEPDDFDRVIDVNVRGAWLAIKYAAPEMAKVGGGSVVVTSSVAGLIGSAGLSPYVMSKHAVIGLVRCAAIELAADNIRVNAVNPGPVDNRMMRSIEEQAAPGAASAVKQGFEQLVPLHRYATNDEVVALMTFLASPEASYCTGGVYTVDGGFTAQ